MNAKPDRPSPISSPVDKAASRAGTYHPRVRDFVRNAYRVVLRREPDEEALAWATTELESGALSRTGLVEQLAASAEFAALRALDDALALAARAREQGIRPRELTAPPGTDERLI